MISKSMAKEGTNNQFIIIMTACGCSWLFVAVSGFGVFSLIINSGPPLPKNMFQMATAPNAQGNGLYVIGGYSKGTGELSSLWEFTCPTAGNFFW